MRIDSIDNSHAMIEIGLKLWNEFATYVNLHLPGSALSAACGLVQNGTVAHTDLTKIVPMPGADNWLTALHVIYRSNVNVVQPVLRHLRKIIHPVVGAVTCYYNQDHPAYGNVQIALDASPFPRTDLKTLKLQPELPTFPQSATNAKLAQMCREWGFFPNNYRQIFRDWKVDETAFLIYAPNYLRAAEVEQLAVQRAEELRQRQDEAERLAAQQAEEERRLRIEYERMAPQQAAKERQRLIEHNQRLAMRTMEERQRHDESELRRAQRVIEAQQAVYKERQRGNLPWRTLGAYRNSKDAMQNPPAVNSDEGKVFREPERISVGDRVRITGFGEGTVRKLKKNRANVLLDKGYAWEGQVSELKLV